MSDFNVEDLLRGALRPDTLKDKFEHRLAELGISATSAASISNYREDGIKINFVV